MNDKVKVQYQNNSFTLRNKDYKLTTGEAKSRRF